MKAKSLAQTNSVHNYFNAFHRLISPVVLSLTVIVSRSRIYANIGHGFSINFDVDLIDTIPQIFVVFRGDIVIFPKAFFKSGFPAFIRRSCASCQIFRFGRGYLLLNYAACRSSCFGRTYCPAARRKHEWCGRYGMHRWAMPIEPVSVDLMRYEHVTICSPIWVFALAAPVRSFCQQASGKIKEVDYLLVHHQNSRYENAAQEMDALLGINHTKFRSVRCRKGVFRRV